MTTLTLRDLGFFGGSRNNYTDFDADARTYLIAVENTDGASLELAYASAVNSFVLGCKTDGIWSAIKACCILAGARTLTGAMVPLVGTAPISVGFTSSDYNRKTGLKGNGGSTPNKYIDTSRRTDADPMTSYHMAAYCTTAPSGTTASGGCLMGDDSSSSGNRNTLYCGQGSSNFRYAIRSNGSIYDTGIAASALTGFVGGARSSSSSMNWVTQNNSGSNTGSAALTSTRNLVVFARQDSGGPNAFTDARIGFYSIGENLDLTKLRTRVTQLFTDLSATIP